MLEAFLTLETLKSFLCPFRAVLRIARHCSKLNASSRVETLTLIHKAVNTIKKGAARKQVAARKIAEAIPIPTSLETATAGRSYISFE